MADPEREGGAGGLYPPGKSQVAICTFEILVRTSLEKQLDARVQLPLEEVRRVLCKIR